MCFFFFKQKTAYELRISDWSSDVCSSDLIVGERLRLAAMIDMAVGEQDLLDRDAMMRGRRLQFRQIAAGIDEGALHRLGAPQQGAILLERGDGDDRGAERGLRHRPEIGPAAESAKEACPTLPLTCIGSDDGRRRNNTTTEERRV